VRRVDPAPELETRPIQPRPPATWRYRERRIPGKVSEAKVRESTVKDDQTPECIVEAVERWRFPKPTDGKPVTVVYPFNLSPG
jgi:hypothetical protein